MAQFVAEDGTEVAIASLVFDEYGESFKVDNLTDFDLVVKAMGWDSTKEFEAETETKATDLLGKFWCVIRNKVSVSQ